MIADSSNPKTIPPDYACGLIVREFKAALMYECQCGFGADRIFYGYGHSHGVSKRYYRGVNACLEYYLMHGWPEAEPGARWKHHDKIVDVFADDLFLCPKCGTFRLIDLGDDPLQRLGLKIEGKIVQHWPERTFITEECEQKIRDFCETRLVAKEFFFKECDDGKACKENRRHAMRRLQRVYGWGQKKRQTAVLPPPPEIEKQQTPEGLRWPEGHIYLIRSGEFFKIGIAKDVKKRVSGIRTSSPHEVKILKTWRCKRPDEVEKIMHSRLLEHRVRGEWFRLPDKVLESLMLVEDVHEAFSPKQASDDGNQRFDASVPTNATSRR